MTEPAPEKNSRYSPRRLKEVYSFTIPPEIMEIVDKLVEYGAFESRSEIVREALLRYLGDIEFALRLRHKAHLRSSRSKQQTKNPFLAVAEVYRLIGEIMQQEADSYPRFPIDVIDRVVPIFREDPNLAKKLADEIKQIRKKYIKKVIMSIFGRGGRHPHGTEPAPESRQNSEDTPRRSPGGDPHEGV